MAVLFTGCGGSRDKDSTSTEPNSKEEAQVTTEAPTETSDTTTEADEEDIVYEGDASSYYIDVVYGEQIDRYYTALSEKWSKEKYTDNGLSNQLIDYYEGNPLNNVGFGFEDLNGDGHWELIIGAISGAEENPAVFEIWTLVDDNPISFLFMSSTPLLCFICIKYMGNIPLQYNDSCLIPKFLWQFLHL